MKITYLTFASIVLLGLTACNNANTTPSANVERQTQQSNPSPVANPANKFPLELTDVLTYFPVKSSLLD